MARVIGYGVCGKNEPYLEATLKEFERLCDETIICCNNATKKEIDLISKYGFMTVFDDREWGKIQWKIKEDFVTNYVAKLKPDMCIALDADEVFDKNLTREGVEKLYRSNFRAFYFRIINLWDEGYQPERSFWNIRMYKWNGETTFPRKNLHCGLAPEWVWGQGFYAPYILKHYGLKDKERREQKAKRYDKYDPKARFIAKEYYDSLRSSPQVEVFDEDKLHQEVVEYVNDIKQKYIKPMEKKENLVIMKNRDTGVGITVEKAKMDDYIRQGFAYVEDYGALENELDEILEPTNTLEPVEEPEEIFKCGQCGKELTSKRALRGHTMGAHQQKKDKKWSWK